MTPVPNCLITVETTPLILAEGNLTKSMGRNTPMELVTSTTNRVPMRRGTS